jgi:hypothetical protein
MWTWKENGNWGMFESRIDPATPNGPLKQIRVQINSRIYARAVAGSILKHSFDQFSGSFHLRAAAGMHWVKPTQVYIPPHLINLQPSVSGMAKLLDVKSQPDGSRVVEVMPWITGGIYEVKIGAALSDPVLPEYRGISIGTLAKVASAAWPLRDPDAESSNDRNGLQDALAYAENSNDRNGLQDALALAAYEIYDVKLQVVV